MRYTTFLVFIMIMGLFFSACHRKVLMIEASTEGCMVPGSSYQYDSLVAVANQQMPYDTIGCAEGLKKRFSLRSANIAKDMNILPLICELMRLEQNPTTDVEMLKIKTEIQQRVLIAITDLNSLDAEITCERERIQELHDALSENINKRINKVTIYSILAGTVSTFIAASIALEGNEEKPYFEQGVTVAGAVAGTYWGLRSLAIAQKIKFIHSRNHLTDIWLKESKSRIYAPFVWNYISKPFTLKGKNTSGIDLVIDKWKELELPAPEKDKKYDEKVKLMLGLGGDYNEGDLENRLKMYEILVDEIITIHYDLNRLQEEIMLGYKPR
jgi:hypothetical protein